MKQLSNTENKIYKLDTRTEEDIRKELLHISQSYVPEWHFTDTNPDIGSVIGILYAKQMSDTIVRYNDILEQYRIDLANMQGVSLRPAIPACATVVMELSEDYIDGVEVPKGEKLLGEAEENIVFETTEDIYVTNSKLKNAFMTSAGEGKIVPLMGNIKGQEIVDEIKTESEEELTEEEFKNFPFGLFDFSGTGIEKNVLLIYHKYLFDIEKNAIELNFVEGEKIVSGIKDGQYILKYYTEEGFKEFNRTDYVSDDTIRLYKDEKCEKININGEDFSLIILEAVENPKSGITIKDIQIMSDGAPESFDAVCSETGDLDKDKFEPFGNELALYRELYMVHQEYFSKPGSMININFEVEFDIHSVALSKQEEEEKLKVIKRRPRVIQKDSVSECFPEEISFEYFNGTGWKMLDTVKPVAQLFLNGNSGKYEITFRCPSDWEDTTVGANNGKAIRMRLLKSDNCYSRPCNHHIPTIKDLKVSYSYEDKKSSPSRLEVISGTDRVDLSLNMSEKQVIPVFSCSKYPETALYLGFDKKMERGPVSILFELVEEGNFQGSHFAFYYSTAKGFSRLKIVDNTKGFMKSERIVFLPPSDFNQMELEGQKSYWIKIVDEDNKLDMRKVYRPIIRNIYLNAVNVSNTETLPESDYYIDDIRANMKFSLYADNILDVNVWVNEAGMLTERLQKKIMAENPDKVRVEYNMLGEIERFFVKWEEVENFDHSENKARHYMVDRLTGTLLFGDGIHSQIPRNTGDIAFTAGVIRCNGKSGNLGSDTIDASLSNLLFVNNIYNPLKSFGGADMETMNEALFRASSKASSRNRLICAADYERAVLSLSSGISQVKTVLDKTKDGKTVYGLVSLVVLTRDYMANPHAFYRFQGTIKEYLLEHCELSIEKDMLNITAPLLVDVSVEMWIEVNGINGTFEIQHDYEDILNDYLNPYSGDEWEIGKMPKFSQIKMLLHSAKKNALIRHILVTASYQDPSGIHECSIEELEVSPYMLCKSGNHKFHFIQK